MILLGELVTVIRGDLDDHEERIKILEETVGKERHIEVKICGCTPSEKTPDEIVNQIIKKIRYMEFFYGQPY